MAVRKKISVNPVQKLEAEIAKLKKDLNLEQISKEEMETELASLN